MKGAHLDALLTSARKKGAEVAGRHGDEIGDGGKRAATLTQERQELSGVAAIGVDRVEGKAALRAEGAQPSPDRDGEIGSRGGECGEFRRWG